MKYRFSNEPAVWIGAITSILVIAADFGFHLSHDKVAHIVDAVPLVMALIVRSQVSPSPSSAAPAPAVAPEVAAGAEKIVAGLQARITQRVNDAISQAADEVLNPAPAAPVEVQPQPPVSP